MDVEGKTPAEPVGTENQGADGQPIVASPAPLYSQAVDSPPPAYAPPPQYAPYPAAPPAAQPRHTGRLLLIVGLIVVLLLAAGGVGAVVANASLSSTYSAEKTVTDYFAAQKGGNIAYMTANANYLKGDGSYSQYFEAGGLAGMMEQHQNTDIQDVNVASTTVVDANTRTVNVTMTWAGHHVVRAYTVHRDLARVHYSFYNSWRIDIPFTSINISLPNQPGTISVDGLTLPQGAIKEIQVVQGFHKVTMASTDLYGSVSADADTIDGGTSVVFPGNLSPTALAAAKATIKKAFNTCDKVTNSLQDCLGRTYFAPVTANTIYYFNLPGYGQVFYTKFILSLTSDPTTNIKLVVSADAGKVAASGTCAYTMTVDGTRKYKFKGTWTAALTMASGSFGWNLNYFCLKAKA